MPLAQGSASVLSVYFSLGPPVSGHQSVMQLLFLFVRLGSRGVKKLLKNRCIIHKLFLHVFFFDPFLPYINFFVKFGYSHTAYFTSSRGLHRVSGFVLAPSKKGEIRVLAPDTNTLKNV